ncbi:MAG: cell division protein FtsA [Pseudomonadota bacterium]
MNGYISDMRAMRQRLRTATKRGLVAVLDVGSAKTACFILQIDEAVLAKAAAEGAHHAAIGALRVVGVGVTQSRGVHLGEILDLEEAQKAIRTALERAEKMAGERVDQVIAAVAGARPICRSSFAEVEVEGETVTRRDIARALTDCDWPAPEEGREVIHAQPVNFTLDNMTMTLDPRGMAARSIAVDLMTISVATPPLRNLATCVRRCDLELAGVVVAPYAASMAGLIEDEHKMGAACIDLGAGATDISVYLRDNLIYADSIRLGGDHLTNDIATALSMPAQTAERIKTLHGGAVATGLDDREFLEVPYLSGGAQERRRISRAALIGVIRPRLEEIFEKARKSLDHAGFDNLPGRRVVLTGGGAQLTGAEEMAQRILDRPVRIGTPLRIAGLPESARGPDFCSAVGLALYAAQPHGAVWDFEQVSGFANRRKIANAWRWFRENW